MSHRELMYGVEQLLAHAERLGGKVGAVPNTLPNLGNKEVFPSLSNLGNSNVSSAGDNAPMVFANRGASSDARTLCDSRETVSEDGWVINLHAENPVQDDGPTPMYVSNAVALIEMGNGGVLQRLWCDAVGVVHAPSRSVRVTVGRSLMPNNFLVPPAHPRVTAQGVTISAGLRSGAVTNGGVPTLTRTYHVQQDGGSGNQALRFKPQPYTRAVRVFARDAVWADITNGYAYLPDPSTSGLQFLTAQLVSAGRDGLLIPVPPQCYLAQFLLEAPAGSPALDEQFSVVEYMDL